VVPCHLITWVAPESGALDAVLRNQNSRRLEERSEHIAAATNPFPVHRQAARVMTRTFQAASVGGLIHCLMPASRRAFLIKTCQNPSKSSTLSAERFSGNVTTTSPSARAERDLRTFFSSGSSSSLRGRGKRGACPSGVGDRFLFRSLQPIPLAHLLRYRQLTPKVSYSETLSRRD
jgi:hypothetical protein